MPNFNGSVFDERAQNTDINTSWVIGTDTTIIGTLNAFMRNDNGDSVLFGIQSSTTSTTVTRPFHRGDTVYYTITGSNFAGLSINPDASSNHVQTKTNSGSNWTVSGSFVIAAYTTGLQWTGWTPGTNDDASPYNLRISSTPIANTGGSTGGDTSGGGTGGGGTGTGGGVPQVDLTARLDYAAEANGGTLVSGSAIELRGTLNLTGQGAASPGAASFYISTDANITNSDTLIAFENYPLQISSAYSQPFNFRTALPSGLSDGTYYIGLIVDSQNYTSEINEANNTSNAVAIKVGYGTSTGGGGSGETGTGGTGTGSTGGNGGVTSVDLRFREQPHLLQALNTKVSNAFDLQFVVENAGSTAAYSAGYGVYLSSDANITSSDRLIYTATVGTGTLPWGSAVNVTASSNLPADLAPGRYYLGVLLDNNFRISEIDETNNASSTIEIFAKTRHPITKLYDFTPDGYTDVLFRHTDGPVSAWQSRSNTFYKNVFYDSSVSPDWKIDHISDFTGDARADLLWRNDNGGFSIWRSDGLNFTKNAYLDNVSKDWHIQAVADFNGDRASDLLWRNDNGSIAEWQSSGNSFNKNVVFENVGLDWHVAAVSDFNGDGKSDLFWRNDNGAFSEWRSTGTSFAKNVVFDASVSPDWQLEKVADFNGDTKADLLWRHSGGAFTVWQSTGSATNPNENGFVKNVYFDASVSSDWRLEVAADFNGDGKADLLWRANNGTLTEWQSNGSDFVKNIFSDGSVSNDWSIEAIGDFNSDYKADLLWRKTDGALTEWQSNGGGFSKNVFEDNAISPNWVIHTNDYDIV